MLLVVSGFYLGFALEEAPDDAAEFLIAADREPADFVVAGSLQSLGLLLLPLVLGYLYRATKHRRKELLSGALALAIGGPVLAAVIGVVVQLKRIDVAGEFAELAGAMRTEDRAEDLLKSGGFETIGGVGFGANVALGFGVVLVGLNAMRAGLMSRFMGILGIIIGVLYVLPIGGGPQLVQLFWLGALGVLFLGRWPGGRGPAWETGKAVPWPSAAEQREALERRRAEREPEPAPGGPGGDGEAGAESSDATARPRSRKRKRRR